ncbi:hypothetical protein [Tissierella sp. Yu-01]|uniref:hypothetical protein n=1 Tax=Tissierella sp. Yu-01 TaxID=3035694 RepID=UPI00240E12A2|nr:hypothetical protein [Tissierella sp. Yu-01]WFA07824.1 hypothetical protein P3962_08770 [Tissierella sp. Yu-01]
MANKLTRREVMLNGMIKKGKKNILEVGHKNYRITDELAKRIRIKNLLLGFETVVLTFIYLFSIEKYRDMSFKGMDKYFMEGLNKTFVFLFLVAAGFIITSLMLLPKDIDNHVKELDS